ncbi:MAG: SprT-like domain-containing protein [Luteolibacter sp.]
MDRKRSARRIGWVSWLGAIRAVDRHRHEADCDGGLTEWCREAAATAGLPELARRVRVTWNSRMQTTAGRAWWPSRIIELNPKLHQCEPDEMWRILKHEMAHLVAYERNIRRRIEPHGREWQAACAELGIPGERAYHTLPFKRRRIKRNHVYVCPHCQSTIHRVKPLRRAVACYSCCRKHNKGQYDDRFRLIKKPLPA